MLCYRKQNCELGTGFYDKNNWEKEFFSTNSLNWYFMGTFWAVSKMAISYENWYSKLLLSKFSTATSKSVSLQTFWDRSKLNRVYKLCSNIIIGLLQYTHSEMKKFLKEVETQCIQIHDNNKLHFEWTNG